MCTFDTNKIYLTWRKSHESQRRIIGLLENKNNHYIFTYNKSLEDAFQDGFRYYPAFSDLNKVYDENVLEVFARRLLNPQRRDYQDFLDYWCAKEYKDNTFALLGLTGAKLLTDNFEFIAPHKETPAKFLTNVSWINIAKQDILDEVRIINKENLEKELTLAQDRNNKFNQKAIQVFYKNEVLGFIKSIHCDNIFDYIENKHKISLNVKNIIRNGIVKEILLQICVK